jgi:hypothetical protein
MKTLRRIGGRRKTDRWQWTLGFALGLVFAFYGACGGGTKVTGPTAQATPTPVPVTATTPAPTPTATPTVDDPNTPNKDWDVSCHAGGEMITYYNGGSPLAWLQTFYTSFDGPTRFAVQRDQVATGKTVTRRFPACSQGDSEPEVGRPAGHCYFDKDGNPFKDPRSPKVEECRNLCVPRWIELEERTIGEWEDYVEPDSVGEATQTTKCYKTQRQLVIVWEQNTCTKEKRELKRYYETRRVETPCPTPPPCVGPQLGSKVSFQGAGDPDTECAKFGGYESVQKQEFWPWTFTQPYTFLICKAGNDRIVEIVNQFDTKCSNGKDISHVVSCTCK